MVLRPILYYTILYYTIRYYTILYDTIRYDTILPLPSVVTSLKPRLGQGNASSHAARGKASKALARERHQADLVLVFFFFLFFLFCFCAGGVGRGISGKSRNGSKRALLSRGEGEVGCWGWENTWIVLVRVPYYSGDFKEGAYSKKTTDISAFCSNYIGVHLVVHDRNIGVQGLGLQGWF